MVESQIAIQVTEYCLVNLILLSWLTPLLLPLGVFSGGVIYV